MLGGDTETTGIDPWHGSLPFLVTLCRDNDEPPEFWEWDVDPITRKPIIPRSDVKEIQKELDGEYVVFHNAKFDLRMLRRIGIDIPWKHIHETTLLSHLADSAEFKDLNTRCILHLGLDLTKQEAEMRQIVQEARRVAKRDYPEWRIAHRDEPDMPSAKETVWKNDLWLPRAIGKAKGYPEDHEWMTVVSTYANYDSEAVLLLFNEFEDILDEEEWRIYEERLKILPISYNMEETGITLSRPRLNEQYKDFKKKGEQAGKSVSALPRSTDMS